MKIRNIFYNLIVLVLAIFTFQLIAQEETQENQTYQEEEDAHEGAKTFDFRYSPYDRDSTDVHGVKFGLPMSSGLGVVKGAELSLLGSDTANIEGFQGAVLVNMTNYIDGMQLGVANMIRQHGNCLQLGLVSFTAKEVDGVQVSLFNYSRTTNGIQIGIINDADNIATLQLGIICYNKEAWIPFFVGFNFDPYIFESSYEEEDETAFDPEGHTYEEDISEISPDTASDTAKVKEKQLPWYNFLGW